MEGGSESFCHFQVQTKHRCRGWGPFLQGLLGAAKKQQPWSKVGVLMSGERGSHELMDPSKGWRLRVTCASATHVTQRPTVLERAAQPSAPIKAAEVGGAVRCSPSHTGQAPSLIASWGQQPARGEVSFGLVYGGINWRWEETRRGFQGCSLSASSSQVWSPRHSAAQGLGLGREAQLRLGPRGKGKHPVNKA